MQGGKVRVKPLEFTKHHEWVEVDEHGNRTESEYYEYRANAYGLEYYRILPTDPDYRAMEGNYQNYLAFTMQREAIGTGTYDQCVEMCNKRHGRTIQNAIIWEAI